MVVDEIQLLVIAALVFIPLERLWPSHHDQRTFRRGFGVDVLHAVISGFIIRTGLIFIGLALLYVCALVIPDVVHATVQRQPGWLQFVELFVLADLCFYSAHRLVHTVPCLWRFHAVHHSSTQLDWLATFRVHPVDQILNSTLIAIPAVVLGFAPGPIAVYALLYRAHAIILHSNVHAGLGWLGHVFASPRYHHWHHANEPRFFNRNFGGQLVIWDRLFGTLEHTDTLPASYGTRTAVPDRYIGQLTGPFWRSLPMDAGEPPKRSHDALKRPGFIGERLV